MNAVEIYRKAENDLEHNRITIGEFDERIEPLKDVECVVRCKDCKFMKPRECYVGNRMGNRTETRCFCYGMLRGERVNPEFYCAAGERKDGGKNGGDN